MHIGFKLVSARFHRINKHFTIQFIPYLNRLFTPIDDSLYNSLYEFNFPSDSIWTPYFVVFGNNISALIILDNIYSIVHALQCLDISVRKLFKLHALVQATLGWKTIFNFWCKSTQNIGFNLKRGLTSNSKIVNWRLLIKFHRAKCGYAISFWKQILAFARLSEACSKSSHSFQNQKSHKLGQGQPL